MVIKNFIYNCTLILVLFLTGCTSNSINDNDIIGEWQTNDDASIIFFKDNSFKTNNLNGNDFFNGFPEYKGKHFSESGKWNIEKIGYSYKIILRFKKSKALEKGFYTELSVSGEGMFDNKPPWYLYISIGDPDDFNKYKFVRK